MCQMFAIIDTDCKTAVSVQNTLRPSRIYIKQASFTLMGQLETVCSKISHLHS